MMQRVGVLQLIDTLDAGGAERVAVNLANHLPRDRYRPYLGTTRRDGALAAAVRADVGRLRLGPRRRFAPRPVIRLVRFLRDQHIDLLHAHSTSIFIAALGVRFRPRTVLVWHDHFGRQDIASRPAWLYRLAVRRAAGVIAVSPQLAAWSHRVLGVAADRSWYLPNFVVPAAEQPPAEQPEPARDLPGVAGQRVICVANLRAQKDHLTLLRAMAEVAAAAPESHLLLAGKTVEPECAAAIRDAIRRHRLTDRVTLLGERRDVAALLRASDVAVLSSRSEGMPLALVEYGAAGLPVVATRVGCCAEILDHGRAGLLVPPGDAAALAAALAGLLRDPARRRGLGETLRQRVERVYRPEVVIGRLGQLYGTLLAGEV